MNLDDAADALRQEIRSADTAVRPVELTELAARRTNDRPTSSLRAPTDTESTDWLVPVTGGDLLSERQVRWPALVGLVAVILVVAFGMFFFGDDDDNNGPTGPAVAVEDDRSAEEPTPRPTALEIVERRYQAMNELDYDAINADVADELTYCLLAREASGFFEGCVETTTDFYGPNGRAEQNELMAMRVHGYGGAIEYSCVEEGVSVVCAHRETHLLLDAAGADFEFNRVVYDVTGGQIIHIEDQPPPADGATTAAVSTQAFAYAEWLEAEYPDEVEALTIVGRPAVTRQTVLRHRELVSEWFASLG